MARASTDSATAAPRRAAKGSFAPERTPAGSLRHQTRGTSLARCESAEALRYESASPNVRHEHRAVRTEFGVARELHQGLLFDVDPHEDGRQKCAEQERHRGPIEEDRDEPDVSQEHP